MLRELRQSALVEVVLKMLQGQGKLKDCRIDVVARSQRRSFGDGGQKRDGAEDGRLHGCWF